MPRATSGEPGFDIVFEKVAQHVDAKKKTQVKIEFAEDMVRQLQYGNGLKAFAFHLSMSQRIALNRVQKKDSRLKKFLKYRHPWRKNVVQFSDVPLK